MNNSGSISCRYFMHMIRHPFASMRRKALAGFGLALFMLGINYCLVGALSPAGAAGMPCMANEAVATADAPASHTGHCAGMAEGAAKDDSAPAPSAPCCIAITPVVAPDLGKVPVSVVAVLPLPADAACLIQAPATSSQLLRAPPESPPYFAFLSAPSSPRAPPAA